MRITRLIRIVYIFWRYGLYELAAPVFGTRSRSAHWFRFFVRGDPASLGRRLREALQELGPIFVKFGQVLSTRRDLLWPSMADELSFLQDQVQPFPADLAKIEIERGLGRKISEAFATFESEPTASASIAQIHFATLPNGKEVAVKVLRPGMAKVIDRDLQWLRFAAAFLQRFSVDARRLRLGEVIDEFDRYLHDELDLIREAANASQLQRNFSDSYILRIPTIYWEWCATNVLTMERMHGVPVSQIDRMRAAGIDFKKLSRDGVQIFFTQVFEHGFFHADMHPGNILVGISGGDFNRYIALDFGIVGTLSDSDKSYLAQNFLAFFRRDYRWAARLHLESGWAPPTTRVDELESAIRTCCEPFFDRPLKSISLGLVLLRLFQTSRRFNIEVQPQLVLLQKTLLNIEGLGRQLDPELDLWVTAQPILERWMKKQIGLSGWIDRLKMEAPKWAVIVPEIPRLLHQFLSQKSKSEAQVRHLTEALSRAQRKIRIGWFLLFLFLFVHLFLAEGEMFSKIIGTILTFL